MGEYGLGTVIDEVMPYGSIMAGDWKRMRLGRKSAINKLNKKVGGLR